MDGFHALAAYCSIDHVSASAVDFFHQQTYMQQICELVERQIKAMVVYNLCNYTGYRIL